MALIFVVGFYEPVLASLRESFQEYLQSGEVIWIPQIKRSHGADLIRLQSVLFQRLATRPERVHIILGGHRRDIEWMETTVESAITEAHRRFPGTVVTMCKPTKELMDGPGVLAEIASIGLSRHDAVTMPMLQRRLGDDYVLCVRPHGRPSFQDALRRSGFCEESWEAVFKQETIMPGKNSSMMERFRGWANHYRYLLYAWHPLRTLKPEVKARFSGKAYEAATPAQAVEMFKRWIVEGD